MGFEEFQSLDNETIDNSFIKRGFPENYQQAAN